MNAEYVYHTVISLVRDHVLTERLFLASVELALLAAAVGLVTCIFRLKMPRLAALLWVVVLVKPLVSLCVGSPIPLLRLGAAPVDANVQTQQPMGDMTLTSDHGVQALARDNEEDSLQAPCIQPIQHVVFATTEPLVDISSPNTFADRPKMGPSTWLILCWGVGVGVMACVALSRRTGLWRIIRLSNRPPTELCDQLARLAGALRIRRVPALRITDQLDSPALAGVLRPVILVPRWLAEEGHTSTALTWSLRHELMHWKMGDPLANLVSGIVRSLFFFHPAAWWSARQWRCAMELACDRALVSSTAEAKSYAEGLYYVLTAVKDRRRLAPLSVGPVGMFATRTQIGQRIEVLLDGRIHARRPSKVVVLAAFILLSTAGLSIGGQFVEGPETSDNATQGVEQTPNTTKTAPPSQRKTIRLGHVIVAYSGVGRPYANAVARTVAAARQVAARQFGFDMPQTIHVALKADPAASVRLFNDGVDRFSLTVRSQQDLLQPSTSGRFHIYGLCHEVGHLAMYRPIRRRRWMTTTAAEGWAHYIGSRLVDAVYQREGMDLWPDRYDYRSDGTQRLAQQLASSARPTIIGAGLWKMFAEAVGDDGVAPIFDAWGGADFDSKNPGRDFADVLGRLLYQANDDLRLPGWWDRAKTVFVALQPRSEFVSHTVHSQQVSKNREELAVDNGKPAGKQSIAGSGHAVRFQVDSDALYLTSVRIHGARYGSARPPKEDFHVWLCDKDFKQIAVFAFPYSKFSRGSADWVTLNVKPTRVPRQFVVCVGFNPSATKGVFVSRDDEGDNSSFTGLPGRPMRAYGKGDWMIRAAVGSGATARIWKDSTGKFSVKAELQEVVDGVVRLKKANGKVISAPIGKLSDADQRFLKSKSVKSPLRLNGKPKELSSDDGKPAGRRSFPHGFAVAYTAPSDSSYLTSVRIHGARYGSPRAPAEEFHISLCDKEFNLIADFPMPYSKFQRGKSTWVSFPVKPTKLPKEFVICLDFKATGAKGVYLSHDAEGRGLMGKPGKRAGSFTGGDWLLRVSVDQPAGAQNGLGRTQ